MAYKVSEEYKKIIYSGDAKHKLKLIFNDIELEDADVFCESLTVKSRIIPNGATRFSLDNFISKEAELILHDINTTQIESPVEISIGTLVNGNYEYVPIGIFVVEDLPTTDNNKTTIKLRDNAVKFDFGYNAKDIIEENDGSVTKMQILQDICTKAGVEHNIEKFYGSNSKIGIYDNSITGRTYISYIAEQAGAIATIDRKGKLIFVYLKDAKVQEIPIEIVEKYENGNKYEISRVVYEDAIRKYEYGEETKDTLFLNSANPYINNEPLTNEVSGTIITLNDSINYPVSNLTLHGYIKQETRSGINLWNNELVDTRYVTKNIDGFTLIKCWATTTFSNENVLKTFKPNTKYTIKVMSKVISKPTTLSSQQRDYDLALYRPEPYEFIALNSYDKVNAQVGDINTTYVTITTPEDLTKLEVRGYSFYGNNDDSTTYQAIGSVEIQQIMVVEGEYTESNFPEYEKYGVSPGPDYPSEIEVGRGKNLADITTFQKGYVHDNGSLVTTGLNYGEMASPFIAVKPNTKYIFTIFETSNDYSSWFGVGEYTDNVEMSSNYKIKRDVNYDTEATSITFTTSADTKYVVLSARNLLGATKIQLEEGPVATNYVPYNAIEVKSTGKNLLNNTLLTKTTTINGITATPSEDGGITLNGTATANAYIRLTCTDFGDISFDSVYAYSNEYIASTGNSSTLARLSYDKNNRASFISVFNGKTLDNVVVYPMIRLATITDDTYEPYKESSVQYDLGDNFLAKQDYIENGVLNKKIGKIVLNGSENWKVFENKTHTFTLLMGQIIGKHVRSYSTHFEQIANSEFDKKNGIYTTYSNQLIISYLESDSIEDFKTWLSTNNVEVYYEQETPEQIQLETAGELKTFEGVTNITNDLDCDMDVEYIRNQTQVSQILELNKNIPINSFQTGKIIGDPSVDPYDIIKIVDDGKEFKTLATYDLTYNGVIINTYDTQIGKEAKNENVTLTSEATFKKWAKTEIDNVNAEVKIVTGNLDSIKSDIDGNYYTKEMINELVTNAETGVTNTFSEAGGNNIFRNTSLFASEGTNKYEFWDGNVIRHSNENATSRASMLLQNGALSQDQEVPNGNYSISFYYKKLIELANASVIINDIEYELDSLDVKQFYTGEQDSETKEYITQPINVTNGHIKIIFKCDTNNGVEVYDLMCNKGSVKLAYSQNQNETTTDTVNISKGITITSSVDDIKFKADYDGIRTLDNSGNIKTKFTDKGMETNEAKITEKAEITGLLFQEVDDQSWITKI